MSSTVVSGATPISAEELAALNDELAALVRAGVPLEVGLGRFSGRASRRLADISARIADELRRGASLPEALDAADSELPPAYRAVVRAGLRSGRLPEALEAVSDLSRVLMSLRRTVGLALIYPLIVVLAAWVLFTLILGRVVGLIDETRAGEQLPERWWLVVLRTAAEALREWGWIVPAAAGVGVVWWGLSRWGLLPALGTGRVVRRLPGVGRIVWNERLAHFNGLLAVLLGSAVPLPEALRLSAGAVGDRRLTRDAVGLAERIERGEALADAVPPCAAFPPFMRWMIQAGQQQHALPAALRQLSAMYRQRCRSQAEWFQIVFPIAATLGIGGGVVIVYAFALFVPLVEMLKGLAVSNQ